MAYGAGMIEGRRGVPELPREVEHVWSMFCDLSAARPASSPISYREIEAYGRLTCNMPTPWEVDQIKRLDAMALEIWARKTTGKPTRSRTAGTDAAGIDRVLNRVSRDG